MTTTTAKTTKPKAARKSETTPVDHRDDIIAIYERALHALRNNEWLDTSRQLSVWRDNYKKIIDDAQAEVRKLRELT